MSGIARIRPRAGGNAKKLSAKWTAWSGPSATTPAATANCSTSTGSEPTGPARKRILQGQLVANEDKILSLYEADVRVIVRKKAGAEVEFGNTLFLAENPQGLIMDWELFRESAPADAALLPRSVARMQ